MPTFQVSVWTDDGIDETFNATAVADTADEAAGLVAEAAKNTGNWFQLEGEIAHVNASLMAAPPGKGLYSPVKAEPERFTATHRGGTIAIGPFDPDASTPAGYNTGELELDLTG